MEKYNLKPLVNNVVLYKDFLEYLQQELDQVHKNMEVHSDPVLYHRAQGEAAFIRRQMKLREKVNGG